MNSARGGRFENHSGLPGSAIEQSKQTRGHVSKGRSLLPYALKFMLGLSAGTIFRGQYKRRGLGVFDAGVDKKRRRRRTRYIVPVSWSVGHTLYM